ncbi:hypothetical protein BaRGS_00013329 [Batillaria attramentaria]|uniref:Uncharacterized protein n=1 Tax=Batillaria attramentaria TaxID=370345 RepID=A0ABD0L801_9CAEN
MPVEAGGVGKGVSTFIDSPPTTSKESKDFKRNQHRGEPIQGTQNDRRGRWWGSASVIEERQRCEDVYKPKDLSSPIRLFKDREAPFALFTHLPPLPQPPPSPSVPLPYGLTASGSRHLPADKIFTADASGCQITSHLAQLHLSRASL